MTGGSEALRHRLAALTPAQRTRLARQLAGSEAPDAPRAFGGKPSPAQGAETQVYPAANGQQRMWFLHQYHPDSATYHSPLAFHLRGKVQVEKLNAALRQVAQRHDSLRTTFALENGEVMARTAASTDFRLRQIPAADRAEADRRVAEAVRLPFDLSAAPPFRAVLVSIASDEHLLLVVMHHIVTDGWSSSIFCRDLSLAYRAGTPVLPALPAQYADYAAAQQRWQQSDSFRVEADYWKRQLAGQPQPVNVPSDQPHRPGDSDRGATQSQAVPAEIVAALKALAQRRGATFFMVLLAAYKIILYRASGQADLLVGVPIANRSWPEVENLIGLFANTLIMRTRLSGEMSFEDVLDRVRETALEAYEHQNMPLEILVRLLQVRREARGTPLVRVTFALRDFPAVPLELDGVEVTPQAVETGTAKFDLSLAVSLQPQGLLAALEYNSDRFSSDRARTLLGQWCALLAEVAGNSALRADAVTAALRAFIDSPALPQSGLARDPASNRCIHDLFEEQAVRHAEAVAISHEGRTLTYGELNGRADDWARHLRSRGVGPDSLVAICVERSLDMIVGLLAILKAGGAYVPLDPANPPERLGFMLGDAKPALLLTDSKLAPRFANVGAEIICLDQPPDFARENDAPAPTPAQVSPHNLAYVIYTSGSTGQPKGVLITHHNVVRLLQATAGWFDFHERDVWTLFHSYAFDFSVWEIWGALLHGGKLVIVPYATSRSPTAFLDLLQAEKVTVLNQTPSAFAQLVQAEGTANPPGELALRYVIFGGEALAMRSLKPWFERHGDRRPQLVNMYGITETTVHVTYRPLTRDDVNAPSLIGRPIPDLQIHLLDSALQPVAMGVTGEMFIGGAGLARGYLHRPELTRERFIPDPFSTDPQARLYRSGDLACRQPDGDLEFMGRADQQLKIRGHRLELGEIEAALARHPEVAACAVLPKGQGGDLTLVAYLVPRREAGSVLKSPRPWLAQRLPDYMIPARFLAVPALPLNLNGKIDVKALQEMKADELAPETAYVPPRNEREKALVQIWQSVLGREQVGVLDNFFELGGHSLLAITLVSRLADLLAVDMPLRWIWEHPTIAELAEKMKSSAAEMSRSGAILAVDRGKPLPMSHTQRQMWLLQETAADAATYNNTVAWKITGAVQPEKIRRALGVILERHEILRTSLSQEGEDLVQQIAAGHDAPVRWEAIDLRDLPAEQREAALDRHILEEARTRFDLKHAPLWRATWFQLERDRQVLELTFHHSIVDEWSERLFLCELEKIYACTGGIENAGLPVLPIQYADFSAWEQRPNPAEEERHRTYWTGQLQDLPAQLELPTDRARPASSTGRGGVHAFQLGPETVGGLRALAGAENTTLFAVIMAGFLAWLFRCTGENDIVVSTPITMRDRPDVQTLLGCFLNTLPIRARVEGDRNFVALVQQVRASVLEAFSHARQPFEKIVEWTVKERGPGHLSLYQVMLVVVEEGLPPLVLGEARTELLTVENNTSKNDLILSLELKGDAMACRLLYDADLFSGRRAADMAAHLVHFLESIAANPYRTTRQLDWLPEASRRQIVEEWNQTQRPYPRDACIHELVALEAAARPDAVAVVFQATSLTYRQLDERAERIAGHLRALGVGPGVVVGLQAERSLEMIVALLGILKAGGAYWAIEENLPAERARQSAADAWPRVVLLRRKESAAALAGIFADDPPVLAVIDEWLASAPPDTPAVATPVQAGDPAYISFTSGSTGRPKGVVIPHRGVVRLVKETNYVSLGPNEVLLHFAPLSFDASTFEIWGALLNGGRVVLLPPGPPALAEIGAAIREQGVTTAWLTAGLFHLMVDERLQELKPLRQLLAGGDVLSPEHVRKALHALPGCRIVNGYGPTENTTFTCCHTISPDEDLTLGVPIGRPIANTCVYILDEARRPVPVGVAGELYAGGDGLACGYLNRPELTAEKFVPNPFSLREGDRLYRTGDRARWRDDGTIEFLGRLDTQVKIRGFRVELGEIELALRAMPEIRDVAVAVRRSASGNQSLAAYLVADATEKPEPAVLRTRLAAQLPDYMVPDAWVWMERLPMTPNGKVDRKALAALDPGEIAVSKGTVPPVDLLELELIRIWQRLFQREEIGREDNFFLLGGHSMLATRLAAQIDRLLGIRIPIATLLQSPTIESLARRLHDENWAPAWSSLVPLQPQGTRPPLFFIHGLHGDVFCFQDLAARLGPTQPSYGVQAAGLDGKSPRHISVEEMATHYANEIVSFQKEGPIYLAGYSLGGVLAYAVAQELQRRKREVALLALFDTAPIGKVPWFFYALAMATNFPRLASPHLRSLANLSWRKWPSYLHRLWPAIRNWLYDKNRDRPPVVTAPLPAGVEPPKYPDTIDYYHAITLPYVLQPYPGAVDIFTSDAAIPGWRWYWRYLARGGVTFQQVPGEHIEILSGENLDALTRALSRVLARASGAKK